MSGEARMCLQRKRVPCFAAASPEGGFVWLRSLTRGHDGPKVIALPG